MNVDQKKPNHESAMNSHEAIPIIELVCNRCQSHGECTVTSTPPPYCNTPQHSVFVFPSSPLYHSIAREFPEGRLHSRK